MTRASILDELTAPRGTSEISNRMELAPATVSEHLQILREAGLLTRIREGRHVLYQRVDKPFG